MNLLFSAVCSVTFALSLVILYGMIWVQRKDGEMGVERNIFQIPFAVLICFGQLICIPDANFLLCIMSSALLISQSFFCRIWIENSPFLKKRRQALDTMKHLTIQMLQDTSPANTSITKTELLKEMVPLGELDTEDVLKQREKMFADDKTIFAIYSNNTLVVKNKTENKS